MALSISEAGERVNELVRMLQKNFKSEFHISVDEVVKGGSLGHGTAVPNDYDLDLVLYSRDIDPNTVRMIGVHTILDKLRTFLSRHFGNNFKYDKTSPFSLQFCFHNDINVDLLPSPYWETPDQFKTFLQSIQESDRRKFSCGASKWQVQFFQRQPNQVKEYIKRFKAWRNERWPKSVTGTGRPKSFLLGLLMVEAYNRSRDKESVDCIEHELKKMIINHSSLDIKWDVESSLTRQEFDDLVKSGRLRIVKNLSNGDVVEDTITKEHKTYYNNGIPTGIPSAPSREIPSILDPGNPFNNVYKSGISTYKPRDVEGTYGIGTGDWTKFAAFIPHFNIRKPVGEYIIH